MLCAIATLGCFSTGANIKVVQKRSLGLTARRKLVVHASGAVSGKIRYGKVVIQEGGQLMGDIQFGAAHRTDALPPAKMGLLNAA